MQRKGGVALQSKTADAPDGAANTPLQDAAAAVYEVRRRAESLNDRLAGMIPEEASEGKGKTGTDTFIDTLETVVMVISEESRATMRFLDHIDERFGAHGI